MFNFFLGVSVFWGDLTVPSTKDTAYIVYDTESVVDGALLARVLYKNQKLSADKAARRYQEDNARDDGPEAVFVPVSFHVPVSVTVARVTKDYRLADIACLDAPRFDSRAMVELFWRGIDVYRSAVLVDFNGRSFDIPLLTLSAFRFGISCPRYFEDPDRFGFRYRFTDKHLDLMEWMTEYGAFRLKGGLNLLAKMLGKPGKMEDQRSRGRGAPRGRPGAGDQRLLRSRRVGHVLRFPADTGTRGADFP